jgi:hypothetical protein
MSRFSFALALAGGLACGRTANQPCGAAPSAAASPNGLTPVAGGAIIYDSNQGICWLANANLASDPAVRIKMGVSGINPDGTMDYATALLWVAALNDQDYLGHDNWQLPNNPLDDPTCTSNNNGSFGVSCTGSALANLYVNGLGFKYPQSVVPEFTSLIPPFQNLQPDLYWDIDLSDNGESTFSFNTDLHGANTTKYNYFHVLPMAPGAIGKKPSGSGVLAYTDGPAAGLAVYDSNAKASWVLDANLAATNTFGITGSETIDSGFNGTSLTVPLIDENGAMLFDAIDGPDGGSGFLGALNAANYAGTNTWVLPGLHDLENLYTDLGLDAGDTRLLSAGAVSPFTGLQPGFYWACERNEQVPPNNSQNPCDQSLNPFISDAGTPYEYSFNFSGGFEGTDLVTKQFYVMVYYPAADGGVLR